MTAPRWLPVDPEQTHWDVVIVGTGIGGATLGHALAAAGRQVLFVEKGPLLHGPDRPNPQPPPEAGRWPHRARANTNLGDFDFRMPVGCVSGGSSAYYAAALERFSPDDFAPRQFFRHAPDTTLPERWPISYEELEPYYERAERLYRVRGTADPLYKGKESELLAPPSQSERDDHLQATFAEAGLHPYRVHVGCEFLEGCQGCPAGPCERDCKRDAASTCLIPALERCGAKLLPECEVVRVVAGPERVEEVICRNSKGELRLRGSIFVIAAGAFMTPVLLMRSKSELWPTGVANRSGAVGRNLMFHGGDYFAVGPLRSVDGSGPQKTLALNDFYNAAGEKLGTFQTLGTSISVGQIMQYLRDSAPSSSAWWRWFLLPEPVWWRKIWSPFVRIAALVAFHVFRFRDAGIWVSILEDLPYHDNCVWPDPDHPQDIRIRYQYSEELRQRVLSFRQQLRQALKRHRIMVLSTGDKIDYPHVCGTCRFGDDPTDSVLDRNNRAHDLQNLYVVDASFFPSSGGTNPSLTIAANALRVADVLLGRNGAISSKS